MRSPEIDLPAEKTDTLDTRTGISSEERTAIRMSNGPDSLEFGGKADNTLRVRRSDATGVIGSDHSQDLLSLPANTLGVCRQPRQEPLSEQTPVIPALGILRREDEERFRMRISDKGPRAFSGSRLRKKAPPRPCAGHQSPLAASFSVIRANLLALGLGKKIKSLAITSLFPGEGKTTVATNLAVNLAQEGMNILLAGVGIRKISFSESMGTEIGPGLTDALTDGGSRPEGIHLVSDVIIQDGKRIIPELNHLHIMTAGTASLTAPERVVSRHLKNFVEKRKKEYDIIIFDTSPALYPADPRMLEKNVDAVLLVRNEGHMPEGPVRSRMKRLQDHCNIIGMVVNYVGREKGNNPYSHVTDAGGKQEARGQMRDSRDAQRELAKITAEEKPRSGHFFLWTIVLVVLVGLALWFSGILPFARVQGPPPSASMDNGPAAHPTTIKQPIKVPATKTESVLQPAEQTGSEEGTDTLPGQPSATPQKASQDTLVHMETVHGIRPEEGKTAPDLPPIPTEHYPYSLHMGSFKTRKLAEKSMALLNEKGLNPYWTVVDLGDKGVWYRVFVGHFKTADAARAFQALQGIKADRILKTRYSVQVGRYSTREEMDQQFSLLKASGYCPYVIRIPPNQYQLLVGSFQTEKAADHLASGLKASGVAGKPILR